MNLEALKTYAISLTHLAEGALVRFFFLFGVLGTSEAHPLKLTFFAKKIRVISKF